MPRVIQTVSAGSVTAELSHVLAFDADVRLGSLLVLRGTQSLGGSLAPTITDSQGNTWEYQFFDGASPTGAFYGVGLWTAVATAAGPCTVTCAFGTAGYWSWALTEVTGDVGALSISGQLQGPIALLTPGSRLAYGGALVLGVATTPDYPTTGPVYQAPFAEDVAISLDNETAQCFSGVVYTLPADGAADPEWTITGGSYGGSAALIIEQPRGPGWFQRSTSGTTATGTTSLTITKPTGAVDGDILICTLAHQGTGWATMPAGWTVVDQVLQGSTRTEMHWKRASGEGANYSITGMATKAAGCMRAYGGGLATGSVVSAFASASAVAGTSAVAASQAVTVPRALLVVAVGSGANDAISRVQAYTTTFSDAGPDPDMRSLRVRANARTTGISSAICDVQKTVVSETGLVKASLIFDTELSGENAIIVAALIPETGTEITGTRYYLSRKYPDRRVEGQPHGDWTSVLGSPDGVDPFVVPYRLSRTKSDAGPYVEYQTYSNEPFSSQMVYYGMTPPLAAQTISGGINLCSLATQLFEDQSLGPVTAPVYWKVHAYISVGQSTTVRHVLLNQYVDTNAFPFLSYQGMPLIATQAMTSGACLDGDSVVLEIGVSYGTFATPTPLRPPEDYVTATVYLGAQDWSGFSVSDARRAYGPAFPDVTAGAITTNLVSYVEFPTTELVELAPALNTAANQVSDGATVIPALPYVSDGQSSIDAVGSGRELWWRWTASLTGTVIAHVMGSVFPLEITALTSPTGSAIGPVRASDDGSMGGVGNGNTATLIDVTIGTTYYFRVRQSGMGGRSVGAPSAGGYVRFSLCQRFAPANDDVFMPVASYGIVRYRGSQLVDLYFSTYAWSGIAIDYTGRSMISLQDGSAVTGHRLYLGIFPRGPVEILDIDTYDEIDYISAPLPTTASLNWEDGDMQSQSQLALTPAGMLHVAWWGNGFTRITGAGSSATNASQLLTTATTSSATLAVIDGVSADNQPGAPFAAATRYALAQGTGGGAGYVAVSDDGATATYTSGGVYLPISAQVVKQFDLGGNSQNADVATLVASTSSNPGVKGLCLLPDGGYLVTNGSEVVRLSAAGAVVTTYTPSPAAWAQSLVDARLTPDGTAFWTMDLETAALFQFDLASGDQLEGFRTYIASGNVTQLAIYALDEAPAVTYGTRTVLQRRLRRFPHLSAEQQWLFYRRLQVDMQAGIGLTDGQGVDPQIMLRWSDDGGATWSHEHWRSAGRRGAYQARAQWWQLGRSRQRTFEIVVSDPVAWAFVAAYFSADPGEEF
jgi:hypothetical protein